MREIHLIGLTGDYFALIDDDNCERVAAESPWYVRPHGRTFYAQANTRRNGKRTAIYLHRLVMGLDGPKVDHRNRNGLDCRRSNLRHATGTQNQANAAVRVGRQFKGVTFTRGGWTVRLAGQYIGRSASVEEAARIYNTAASAIWGDFARLNEVKD